MSANPKHRTSDTPCKKCQSRERYKSTRNCVGCAKNAVRRKRGQLELPTIDVGTGPIISIEQLDEAWNDLL